MAISIFSKVESLESKTQSFGLQAAACSAELRGKKVTVDSAEGTHRRIQETFQKVMGDIAQIKEQINNLTTRANEEQMINLIIQVTGFEETLSDTFKLFNNTFLTYCPTAKISYGEACIGAKIAPKINTKNVKVLETLANVSQIRKIRGDGNCFLSALSTRLLETIVQEKGIARFIGFISDDCIDAPELKNELVSTLFDLQDDPSALENILQDNKKILPFVNYFRKLAAQEMKEHKDHYEVFFLSDLRDVYGENTQGQSFENLVDKFVLTMGVDFSQPMIEALCRKLDFPVRIIDPKIGAQNGLVIPEGTNPKAAFCLEDKHYYVLYTPVAAPQKIAPTQPIAAVQKPSATVKTTTVITVKCDAQPGNEVFIRGSYPLRWDAGTKLRNVNKDTWVFETTENFQNCDYKILINDTKWEQIDGNGNHKIDCGKKEEITPRFSN